MQRTATPPPSPASPSFAGLLAALATPMQPRALAWSDDNLADDVATLSYERALHAHSRYKSADSVSDPIAPAVPSDRSLTESAEPGPVLGPVPGSIRIHEAIPADLPQAAPTATPQVASSSNADVQSENTHSLPAAFKRNLKCASITIRLSTAESAQLRNRAAEAGLTVSAYLRSCTFEAESLRALVKDTLAQLRSDSSESGRSRTKQGASASVRRSWLAWLFGLLPRLHFGQRIAQA